jgi:hypothetical protein
MVEVPPPPLRFPAFVARMPQLLAQGTEVDVAQQAVQTLLFPEQPYLMRLSGQEFIPTSTDTASFW